MIPSQAGPVAPSRSSDTGRSVLRTPVAVPRAQSAQSVHGWLIWPVPWIPIAHFRSGGIVYATLLPLCRLRGEESLMSRLLLCRPSGKCHHELHLPYSIKGCPSVHSERMSNVRQPPTPWSWCDQWYVLLGTCSCRRVQSEIFLEAVGPSVPTSLWPVPPAGPLGYT